MIFLKSDDLQKVYAAKEMLDRNFKKHFTTDELARLVGLNEYKLKYGFRNILNISLYKYLSFVRIEKAKYVLEYTDYPVKYVAVFVGIPDIPTFNKIFKRFTGI